ncbi:hypothetical protein GUJ93_ZPchr0010g10868 [Zizania palustris]|uniref:Uncharacterized protein n=1 Tax=Zizania palustris TaxID=103762 RepID=A0A8J5WF55_ZIZPA|nr:hypothetical protein GUJ93_ZPchr0010g10868 [Zizania palustris]
MQALITMVPERRPAAVPGHDCPLVERLVSIPSCLRDYRPFHCRRALVPCCSVVRRGGSSQHIELQLQGTATEPADHPERSQKAQAGRSICFVAQQEKLRWKD